MKGDDHPIHKAQAGGWSQRRNQQRVDATWEVNADEVAAEVACLVKRVDARLVLVAGDRRAVTLLCDSLPADIRELVREVEGSRAENGSDPLSEHDVRRLLATEVAANTTELVQKLKEERGQATGPPTAGPPRRRRCPKREPPPSSFRRRWRAPPSGTARSRYRWPVPPCTHRPRRRRPAGGPGRRRADPGRPGHGRRHPHRPARHPARKASPPLLRW